MCAKRFLQDRSGAGALEFALVTPAVLMLLFGAFQYAWAMHNAASVDFALEQASRDLVTKANVNQAQLQATVDARLKKLAPGSVTVVLTRWTTSGVKYAKASASYKHPFQAPFLPKNDWTLTSSVVVVTP